MFATVEKWIIVSLVFEDLSIPEGFKKNLRGSIGY